MLPRSTTGCKMEDGLSWLRSLMIKFGWNGTLGQTIGGIRFRVQY